MTTTKEMNQHVLETLPDVLASLRNEKKLSRYDLAHLSGVHYDVIRRLEERERSPNLKTLVKLANAFDVRVADILKGVG